VPYNALRRSMRWSLITSEILLIKSGVLWGVQLVSIFNILFIDSALLFVQPRSVLARFWIFSSNFGFKVYRSTGGNWGTCWGPSEYLKNKIGVNNSDIM
jgi:hypothetical protein